MQGFAPKWIDYSHSTLPNAMQKEREMKEKQELNMGTTCLEIGIKREDEEDKNNKWLKSTELASKNSIDRNATYIQSII